jgi:predicted nucleic acid-binding protein
MNGKELLIDTNIVIYLLNKDDTIAELLRGKQIYISFITELELIGFKNLNSKEEKLIETFLQDCHIIGMNGTIKQHYRELRKKYHIKLADSIIAATAIASDLPLLSADKRLKTIKGLDLLIYNV